MTTSHWQNTINHIFMEMSSTLAILPKQWDSYEPHQNLILKEPNLNHYLNIWTYIVWVWL